MKRLICVIVSLLLVRCGEALPPKRGPVAVTGGVSPRGQLSLTASLNCALPGDVVVFDLDLMNNEPLPLTLVGTPVIEIILDDGHHEILWSHSRAYPQDIDSILHPGERRHYQWRWVAADLEGEMAAVVKMDVQSPGSAASRPTELILPMGITAMSWTVGGSPMPIACSALR